jgi:hypothetical protein
VLRGADRAADTQDGVVFVVDDDAAPGRGPGIEPSRVAGDLTGQRSGDGAIAVEDARIVGDLQEGGERQGQGERRSSRTRRPRVPSSLVLT